MAFYNNAANNTHDHRNFTAQRHNVLNANVTEGVLQAVNAVLNDLRENTNVTERFVNGRGTNDTSETPRNFLPVSGQPYMSRLRPAYVHSASATQNANGTFTINIRMNDESFRALTGVPHRHDTVMDTLDVDWNDLPLTVHEETMAHIRGATIRAVVSPDGQLLQSLHIDQPVEVRGQVQAVFWLNIAVTGYWRQNITFTYH